LTSHGIEISRQCPQLLQWVSSTRALFNRLIKPEVRRQLEHDSQRFPPVGAKQTNTLRPTTTFYLPGNDARQRHSLASTTDKANRLDRPVDTGATKRYMQLAVEIKGVQKKQKSKCTEESLALSSPRPKRQQIIERRTLRNKQSELHQQWRSLLGGTMNARRCLQCQQYYECTEESPASIIQLQPRMHHGGFSGKNNNNSVNHTEVSPVGLQQQWVARRSLR
jgi:hypothetical protein